MKQLRLPHIADATSYANCFNDVVWESAAAAICSKHKIPCRSLRRSPQGENLIFFVDETLVVKILVPLRETYLLELAALGFAHGRLSINTPEVFVTGEIEGWSYLVMTQLAGYASRDVWASIGERHRLEIVSRLGVAMS